MAFSEQQRYLINRGRDNSMNRYCTHLVIVEVTVVGVGFGVGSTTRTSLKQLGFATGCIAVELAVAGEYLFVGPFDVVFIGFIAFVSDTGVSIGFVRVGNVVGDGMVAAFSTLNTVELRGRANLNFPTPVFEVNNCELCWTFRKSSSSLFCAVVYLSFAFSA